MFNAGFQEAVDNKIEFTNTISFEILHNLLRYLYTSTISIAPENTVELYFTVLYFELEILSPVLRSVIRRNMDASVVFDILILALDMSDDFTIQFCTFFIAKHWIEVEDVEKRAARLPKPIQQLLLDCKRKINSESLQHRKK